VSHFRSSNPKSQRTAQGRNSDGANVLNDPQYAEPRSRHLRHFLSFPFLPPLLKLLVFTSATPQRPNYDNHTTHHGREWAASFLVADIHCLPIFLFTIETFHPLVGLDILFSEALPFGVNFREYFGEGITVAELRPICDRTRGRVSWPYNITMLECPQHACRAGE
jgi:hypothetical protein